MLKQRQFVINYILNNQPESIDVHTDVENITTEDAENFIYEVLDTDQPANITDIRVFQRPIDGGQPETYDSDLDNNSMGHENSK
jgi:hypothetical protein